MIYSWRLKEIASEVTSIRPTKPPDAFRNGEQESAQGTWPASREEVGSL